MSVPRVAVVGGGIAGLTAAFHLREGARRSGRGLEVVVLEAEPRAGGHAWTLREDGFLVELGPNGFLEREREPEALELVRLLGIESHLVEARRAARRRFVLHRGRLRRVPDSPVALFGSNALSARGKLRLLMEPWAPAPPAAGEESVLEFARRRIGREAAEVLVDAAVAGISAGDSRALSAEAAFPRMVEMEREHGSLIRAMMRDRPKRPTRLVSFDGGMATAIDALRVRLAGGLRTGCRVTALERANGDWTLRLDGRSALTARAVVLALPASRAAGLVEPLDPELAAGLARVRFAGLAVVALAYRRSELPPLDGYGYLTARGEGLDTLGVLWESSVFEGRARPDTALLRVMLGGTRNPEVAERSEAALVATARAELDRVMGIAAAPMRTWVRRWPRAIAQYEMGHLPRLRELRRRIAEHPGLALCGSSYDGASFTGAIRSGAETARAVLSGLESGPETGNGRPHAARALEVAGSA